jgi:transposase-like protein
LGIGEWLKGRRQAILLHMDTATCPHCGANSGVRRWGHNRAGTQRYRCLACRRNFTPAPKEQGHGAIVHEQAVRLYLEGMSLRAIGRLLGVVHQSVANWVAAHAATVPTDPTDHPPPDTQGDGTVEVDELETFIGGKKPVDQRHRRGGARYPADRRAAGDVGR